MAAAQTLERVDAALKSLDVQNALSESYGSTKLLDAAAVKKQAKQAVLQTKDLLISQHGLAIAGVRDGEIAAFVRDASTADRGTFTASEYQVLVETIIKYAALKARHNNGRRWGMGLSLSAVGAVALSAAVFTSAGLLLVAAPAGAAIGAVAVAADGRKKSQQDRRTAKQTSNSAPEPAAADIAAEPAAAAPAGYEEPAEIQEAAAETPDLTTAAAVGTVAAVAAVQTVAAADHPAATASGESSPRAPSSEDLVSAVVEVVQPTAADAPKESAPATTDAAPADAAADATTQLVGAASSEAADADADALPLPELVKSASPEPAESVPDVAARSPPAQAVSPFAADTAAAAGPLAAAAQGSQLPPLPLKKQSSLKQAYKSAKRALGIPSKKDKDTANKDVYPPTPKRNSFSFTRRNSFSSDMSEDVESSKGSFRKFLSLRRSLDTPLLSFRKSHELPRDEPKLAAAY